MWICGFRHDFLALAKHKWDWSFDNTQRDCSIHKERELACTACTMHALENYFNINKPYFSCSLCCPIFFYILFCSSLQADFKPSGGNSCRVIFTSRSQQVLSVWMVWSLWEYQTKKVTGCWALCDWLMHEDRALAREIGWWETKGVAWGVKFVRPGRPWIEDLLS